LTDRGERANDPDLFSADVTGTNVFDERERTFEFGEEPVFANVVLAGEINRAPPKTQTAPLEAMEERQVTVDGEEGERDSPGGRSVHGGTTATAQESHLALGE